MKIFHVVSYFPPDRIGGVGEVASWIHRGLLAEGHDSVVLTSGRPRGEDRIFRIAAGPVGFILGVPRYVSMTRDFDLVHCQGGDALGLLVAMRLIGIRTPVLATFHVCQRGMGMSYRPYQLEGRTFGRDFNSWQFRYVKTPLNGLGEWLSVRLTDEISFISRAGAEELLGPGKGAVAPVIYNALASQSGERNSNIPKEPTELLYVGTASHRKRILSLPFVLRRFREKVPGARLRLIGFELESQPELVGLFRELGTLDGVVGEGKMLAEEIRPFYRASKVILVTSAYEGLPMVIIEAFQSGFPCVATRVSGHPEVIVDGENGFLVDVDRPDQMADRCIEILKDPDLHERMSLSAQETIAERFTLERQIKEYLALYRKLVGHGQTH